MVLENSDKTKIMKQKCRCGNYEADSLMPEIWGDWPTQILLFFKFQCNSHFTHETFPDYCPPHLLLSYFLLDSCRLSYVDLTLFVMTHCCFGSFNSVSLNWCKILGMSAHVLFSLLLHNHHIAHPSTDITDNDTNLLFSSWLTNTIKWGGIQIFRR